MHERDVMPLTSQRHKTRHPGVYYRFAANGQRRYQISYKDSAGTRVFKTVDGNERDAVRQRNQILERMHKGERVVSSKLTVKELAEDYLRTQTGHMKASTVGQYGYSLDHWVLPKLGTRKVSELTVNDIADFIAEMRQDFTASTIRNCLKPLSRMFQYAARRGWTSHNPVSALDSQERPKGSSKRMRILDTDEIQQLLAVRYGKKSSDYKLLFMTAIFTGLRKGELLSLTWKDIDLLKSVLTVREGKTAAASREVVVPDFLVQAFAEESLTSTSENVFPFDKRNCNRALETALGKAGLEHIRFHDLRHTYASLLISEGMDVAFVAQQMGHSNPSTTLKVYARLFDPQKRKQEAREKLNAFKEVVT